MKVCRLYPFEKWQIIEKVRQRNNTKIEKGTSGHFSKGSDKARNKNKGSLSLPFRLILTGELKRVKTKERRNEN